MSNPLAKFRKKQKRAAKVAKKKQAEAHVEAQRKAKEEAEKRKNAAIDERLNIPPETIDDVARPAKGSIKKGFDKTSWQNPVRKAKASKPQSGFDRSAWQQDDKEEK